MRRERLADVSIETIAQPLRSEDDWRLAPGTLGTHKVIVELSVSHYMVISSFDNLR